MNADSFASIPPFPTPPLGNDLFPIDQFSGLGQLQLAAEELEPASQVRISGDPLRQLVLRQAPLRARVTSKKDKDRKPIDPPPIVQLVDKRSPDSRSSLYDSPFLLLTASLVPENYEDQTQNHDLPPEPLTGSLVSSVYRLRDLNNTEGGFFVFGDISVRHQGRFRLLFSLFERDESIGTPSFSFVSDIVTNVFTVFQPNLFPGMADSTTLTRSFCEQGVKVKLRKDSSALATRKRTRPDADGVDTIACQQTKRFCGGLDLALSNHFGTPGVKWVDPVGGQSSFDETNWSPSTLTIESPNGSYSPDFTLPIFF